MSTESTRSRAAILAAKSSRSTSGSQSVPSSSGMPNRRSASAASAAGGPYCRLKNRTPGTLKTGSHWSRAIDRLRRVSKSLPPCHEMPTLSAPPTRANNDRHFARRAASVRRNPIVFGKSSMRRRKKRGSDPTCSTISEWPIECRAPDEAIFGKSVIRGNDRAKSGTSRWSHSA